MRKTCTAVVLLWSSLALAQTPAADKPAAPPPTDAKAPMAAPKPPAELQQLKDMVGTWKCDGKTTIAGKEMVSKMTARFNWDLDNYFVVAAMDSPKSKDNPTGYKSRATYGYDAGGKQFVAMGVDSMGGMSMLTSKGWDGDKMDWAGKTRAMGQEMDTKETITRKGPREVTISGTSGPVTWESTCKK